MKIFAILIGALLTAVPVRGQDNVEAIVAQKVQPILPGNGKGGGVAVAVRINGETRFFNYGFANDARNERVTADSIFNLGSVGKLFATTRGNTSGRIEANTRGQISSGFLIPGRRTRSMSLESSICIRIPPWFCCGLPSNAASTHRSPD